MKHRRRHAVSAEPTGALRDQAPTPLDRSPWALVLVAVLIVCYVAVYYTALPFRWQVLQLVFAPDLLWQTWFGGDPALPGGLLDRFPVLLVAGGILLSAWVTGSLVVRGWRLDRRLSRLETELFCLGAGLSLWSIWTLLIGLFGLLHYAWLVWLPAPLAAALAGFQMAGRQVETDPSRQTALADDEPGDRLWIFLLVMTCLFAVLYLLAACLPPFHFDVLEYHLQAPKEWHQQGQITFLPHNVYANMPLGAEMFALLAMTIMPGESGWWYGALVGKVVQASMSILTALLLYAAVRRSGSRIGGALAAAAYLSTPWVYLVSVSGLNEGALAYYLALAVYAVWMWRLEPPYEADASSATSDKAHLLKLAGFFAGSAAAVKYTGVLFVVLPLLLAVVLGHLPLRRWFSSDTADTPGDAPRWRFPIQAPVMFLIGALAACGLWYAKNWALAGNPVYPLAYNVFGGETRTPEKHAQWQRAHDVPRTLDGSRFAPAQTIAALSSFLLQSPWLSPLLMPLAVLAALAVRLRRTAFWLAMFLLFYMVCWWLFTHRLERFWAPALVLVAWLAGLGVTWSRLSAWRHFLVAMAFWGLISNFLAMAYGVYFAGAQEHLPDARLMVSLEALRDAGQRPAHRFLNEQTPPGYQVLLVGDALPFDLRPPAVYNTAFDDVEFDRLFEGRTRDERLKALRAEKIAYIYIDWREIARYRSRGNYGFSDYITRQLVHEELVKEQELLAPVKVEGLDPRFGEVFETQGVVPRPKSE